MSTQEPEHLACLPCRQGAHDECDSTPSRPCSCFVCTAAEIGEEVMGEGSGDYLRRKPR